MTTPATLFGIEIIDRASRLVAADAAEERALVELANDLRATHRPLVLERADPHVTFPSVTRWLRGTEAPAHPWRPAYGLLENLMERAGARMLDLFLVPVGYNIQHIASAWRRWHLDRLDTGEGSITAPASPEEFRVMPGAMLVCRLRASGQRFSFFACYPDAHRFGCLHVPAFVDG